MPASAGRARRFAAGLGVGYLHTAIVTVAGLWLTPYVLHRLDEHEYGLWLVAAQMLFYLALADAGVVALLTREVARTTGRSEGTGTDGLRRLFGETMRLVLWQLPLASAAALATWWFVASEWPTLGGPFAIVAATFLVTFPLRIVPAFLQGLQDLAFVGATQLAAWMGGTVVTVLLIETGFGIDALAVAWSCTQLLAAGLAWWRLQTRFHAMLPRRLPPLAVSAARARLSRGAWISVSQVAQVLLAGTDVLVVGTLLGPAATVPYVCTAKLITLLSNLPQLFMQTALPALSELRTSVPRERLFLVVGGMSQILLIGSGLMACLLVTVNGPFVSWWVGADRYGGSGLTLLLVLGMLLRHWNVAAVYTLFCFGNERRLAITAVADGLVGGAAMLLLVPQVGVVGAALGSLVGVAAVSLPVNLTALAREEGVPVMATMRPLRPWFIRFLLASLLLLTMLAWRPAAGIVHGVLAAAGGALLYAALMTPLLFTPSLQRVLYPHLQPWLLRLPDAIRARLPVAPLP